MIYEKEKERRRRRRRRRKIIIIILGRLNNIRVRGGPFVGLKRLRGGRVLCEGRGDDRKDVFQGRGEVVE